MNQKTAASVRVLIIGDTHGELDPRIACLAADSDYVVHTGDVGAAEVLSALQPRLGLVAVRGNNDVAAKWPAGEAAQAEDLPPEALLSLPGGKLAVVHGHRLLPAKQRLERLRRAYPDARAVAFGHTHRLGADCSMQPWVLNPGAAGRTRTYGGPSYLYLWAGRESWQVECHRLPPLGRRGAACKD